MLGDNICDTSFCDAIANVYNEMVLKIFLNTIAKRHVKRLTAVLVELFNDERQTVKLRIPIIINRSLARPGVEPELPTQ